uniref:J domain-containing protein n=1 Tax=Cannabis sativa TaxID=3483 RepID=A0A803NFS8_CANSA
MAVSSMAKGSILLPFPNLVPQRFSNTSLNYVVFQSKQQQLVKFHMIRSNSNDTSSSSSTVETTITSPEDATTQEEEDSIEETEESPSLISALNVERALRGIPITDVDYYGKLGLSRDCSLNQVNDAYRIKSEELKNRGLEEEELNKELQLLKESYTILSTVEERRLYDWSLSRSEKTDKYVWPFEVDSTKPPQDEPPQQPEDIGPTRAVGYFILGWVILSTVLSIALNR